MEDKKLTEQPSFDKKMEIAEQEFKLHKADSTAKQLEDRKSKANRFGYFFLFLTVVANCYTFIWVNAFKWLFACDF